MASLYGKLYETVIDDLNEELKQGKSINFEKRLTKRQWDWIERNIVDSEGQTVLQAAVIGGNFTRGLHLAYMFVMLVLVLRSLTKNI